MSFIVDPSRDASSTIAGFIYQIDVTVERWLNLQPNELLELERGEDLDVVQISEDHVEDVRTLLQVKTGAKALTLRSEEALAALANFCDHRRANPSHNLKFQFLTTRRVGKEKNADLRSPAIELWESIRIGGFEGDVAATLPKIVRLLRGCRRPGRVGLDSWAALTSVLQQEGSTEFMEVVQAFEWSMSSGDAESVEQKIKQGLLESHYASKAEIANAQLDALFFHVAKKACAKGLKQLTTEELRLKLARPELTDEDQLFLETIRAFSGRMARVENTLSQHSLLLASLTGQLESLAGQVNITVDYNRAPVELDAPVLVTPNIPRLPVVEGLVAAAADRTWLNVVGEPGSGKTQLSLLYVSKVGGHRLWISLRGLGQERAAAVLDEALETVSGIKRHVILRPWYEQIIGNLPSHARLVLDDLPQLIPGNPLDVRLQALANTLHQDQQMITTSYYELPRLHVEAGLAAEKRAPRFTGQEITQLLEANGAPSRILDNRIISLLQTSTAGLPTIVAAVIRFLKSEDWRWEADAIGSLLTRNYAAGVRQDARRLIEGTVPDAETRKLIYGLACVVGPISRSDVEAVGKSAGGITLPMEKLSQILGLWVQPYDGDTYALSPLVDHNLADLLGSETVERVHAALGTLILKRKLSLMDVAVAVHHFRKAKMDDLGAIVLIQALSKLLEVPGEVQDEFFVTTIWADESLPESVNINLRLALRAVQVSIAEMRNKENSFLDDDVQHLLRDAGSKPGAQLGVFMLSSLLASTLIKKEPPAANRYILTAMRSAQKAYMPDGSPLDMPKEADVGWMLWATAAAAGSDTDVQDWLETVKQLTPGEIKGLSELDMGPTNSVIMPDSIWLRESQKPEPERNWQHVEKLLLMVEHTARHVGLTILAGAAIRARIVTLAESRNELGEALNLAETSLTPTSSDQVRFLIEEAIGRQLAYADQWEEALRWMGNASSRASKEWPILRRNLLITIASGVARYDKAVATEYSFQAVEVAKGAGLEPVRIAEALGEHAIALWRADRRAEAFSIWEEAVQALLLSKLESRLDIQTALAFMHAAGYFAGMAMHGRPPNEDYAVPEPGFFLSTDRIPTELYRPLKRKIFLANIASFAEGIGNFEAAGKWIGRALEDNSSEPGRELLIPFAPLAITPAILAGDYSLVLKAARSMSERASASVGEALGELDLPTEARVRMQGVFSDPRRGEVSLIYGLLPLAFKVSTLHLKGDVSSDLQTLRDAVNELPHGESTGWAEGESLIEAILQNDNDWKALYNDGNQLYSEHRYAFGVICFLGSILRAPATQSLITQISLARDLEKLLLASPSIKRVVVLPFFEAYWDHAIATDPGAFRTAENYTRRRFQEVVAVSTEVRLKELLRAMIFCLGVSLSSDLRGWLDSDT